MNNIIKLKLDLELVITLIRSTIVLIIYVGYCYYNCMYNRTHAICIDTSCTSDYAHRSMYLCLQRRTAISIRKCIQNCALTLYQQINAVMSSHKNLGNFLLGVIP